MPPSPKPTPTLSPAPTNDALKAALAKARGAFLSVALFSVVINLLMLVAPLYMMQLYDRVLTSRSVPTLVMLTLLAVALLAVMAVLESLRSRILVRVGAWLEFKLDKALFDAAFHARLDGTPGSPAQPLRDLDTLRNFLTGPALLAAFDSPWTPVFIVIISLLHPLLGLLAAGGAVLLFMLTLASDLATRHALTRAAGQSHIADAFAETSLRNTEAIHAMGMLPGLLGRWRGHRQTALKLQARASDRAGFISALTKFTRAALQIVVLGTGAWLAIEQAITPGVMIAASIMLGRALAPVEMLIGGWRSFVLGRAAWRRLTALLTAYPSQDARMALPPPKGRLTLEGIFAAPPGSDRQVLRAVSLLAAPGELIGVIGPSGAGKSTLARVIGGAWQPRAGHVRLDGADLTSWPREAIGPYIGYLPQGVELFDGTVADNIARFGAPDPDLVVAAARAAGAHEMILRFPLGYDTPLGEGGQFLSGGQRQRIGLARALYGHPTLLVLDEPNSNLDAAGEEALAATLANLKDQGRTAMVITHRPGLLAHADKLLVLRDGAVEHLGPRQEVLARLRRAQVAATDNVAAMDASRAKEAV